MYPFAKNSISVDSVHSSRIFKNYEIFLVNFLFTSVYLLNFFTKAKFERNNHHFPYFITKEIKE